MARHLFISFSAPKSSNVIVSKFSIVFYTLFDNGYIYIYILRGLMNVFYLNIYYDVEYSYQTGSIYGYTFDEYHLDTTGNPKRPIEFTK